MEFRNRLKTECHSQKLDGLRDSRRGQNKFLFLIFPRLPVGDRAKAVPPSEGWGPEPEVPSGEQGWKPGRITGASAGPGGRSGFARPVAAGPWVESGTQPWAFSGCRMPLPSHVPGPARLGLGTTRPPQQGLGFSFPAVGDHSRSPRRLEQPPAAAARAQHPGALGSPRALSTHPSFLAHRAWVLRAQGRN